jgi:hypothetical protein
MVTARPTFSVYGRVAGLLSVAVEEVPLAGEFSAFDTDAVIKKASGARLVILASPNNPTGTVLAGGEACRLAGAVEGLLVVDEVGRLPGALKAHRRTPTSSCEDFPRPAVRSPAGWSRESLLVAGQGEAPVLGGSGGPRGSSPPPQRGTAWGPGREERVSRPAGAGIRPVPSANFNLDSLASVRTAVGASCPPSPTFWLTFG